LSIIEKNEDSALEQSLGYLGGTLKISDSEFQKFQELVYQRAGINLHQGKKQLVQARLGKIIRREGLRSFEAYYQQVLKDETGNKLVELLDRISTNHTFFFREQDHLDRLSNLILPDILESEGVKDSNEIRIWSAGCSSGEEPYSIAIQIVEHGNLPPGMHLKILATDLSTKVVTIAEQGVYKAEKLKNVPMNLIRKYFQEGSGKATGYYRVASRIRSLITFRKFNLMDPFPFRKQFDVIFCRNVMIYFDKQIQQQVVDKFYQYVKPGGYFIVGHSESLSGVKHQYKYIMPTIYKKRI